MTSGMLNIQHVLKYATGIKPISTASAMRYGEALDFAEAATKPTMPAGIMQMPINNPVTRPTRNSCRKAIEKPAKASPTVAS